MRRITAFIVVAVVAITIILFSGMSAAYGQEFATSQEPSSGIFCTRWYWDDFQDADGYWYWQYYYNCYRPWKVTYWGESGYY